jgi:hypothetical protein
MNILIRSNKIIWSIDKDKYSFTKRDLSRSYINNINIVNNKKLTIKLRNQFLNICKQLGGETLTNILSIEKDYQHLTESQFKSIIKKNIKLGKGKYGKVYLYNKFAIKAIKPLEYEKLPIIDGSIEAKILFLLKETVTYNCLSPNIITLYQYFGSPNMDYLVLEKMDITLWHFINTSKCTTEVLKSIILQVLFTLIILQTTYIGFRHNDLKTDNILLDITPRNKNYCLKYKNNYWKINKELPLVKISDFDYTNIPDYVINPKVKTSFSKSFGCSYKPNNIYDVHIFLNSINMVSKNTTILYWIKKQLPLETIGTDNIYILYGRLRNPEKYLNKIKCPDKLILDSFFKDFIVNKSFYPRWGI